MRGEADKAVGRGRSGRRPPVPADEGDLAPDPSLRRAVAAKRRRPARRPAQGRRQGLPPRALRGGPLAAAPAGRAGAHGRVGPRAPRPHVLPAGPLEARRHRARGLPQPERQHRAAPGAGRLLPGPRAAREGRRALGGAAGRVARARRSSPRAASSTPARSPTRAASRTPSPCSSASKPPTKRPQEHHLRVTYALADLYERAGDVPKARQLFAHRGRGRPGARRRRAPASARCASVARRRPPVTPPAVRSGPSPSHVRSPHRRRHPCPAPLVPAPGTNLVRPRRHPQPRRPRSGTCPRATRSSPSRSPSAPRAGPPSPSPWPGSGAPAAASRWAAGEEVLVVGRVRRRFFRAGGRHPEPHRGGRHGRRPHPARRRGRQGAAGRGGGRRRAVVTPRGGPP